jgi:hypothetical protein
LKILEKAEIFTRFGVRMTAANTAVCHAPHRGWLHKMHYAQMASQLAICTANCQESNHQVHIFQRHEKMKTVASDYSENRIRRGTVADQSVFAKTIGGLEKALGVRPTS